MVLDPIEFLATFLPGESRCLTRTGISLHRLEYWSDALAPWVGQHLFVTVHYDPRDITFVCVRTPAGPLTKAAVTTPDTPAISLAEWEARRNSERAACKAPELVARADASQKRGDALVSQAKASRRVRRRKATEAAGDRWRTTPSPTAQTSTPPPAVDPAEMPMTLPESPLFTPTYFEIEEYDDVA